MQSTHTVRVCASISTHSHSRAWPRIIYFKLQNCLWPNRFSYALAPRIYGYCFMPACLFFQLDNNNKHTAVVYGRLCDFIYGLVVCRFLVFIIFFFYVAFLIWYLSIWVSSALRSVCVPHKYALPSGVFTANYISPLACWLVWKCVEWLLSQQRKIRATDKGLKSSIPSGWINWMRG